MPGRDGSARRSGLKQLIGVAKPQKLRALAEPHSALAHFPPISATRLIAAGIAVCPMLTRARPTQRTLPQAGERGRRTAAGC